MIPIRLIMENFISHTKSEIDFNQFDVALIVGVQDNNPSVSNGAGKTSIFDAIRFALYNKTRFNMKEKVVKRGKFKCRVEFVFSVSDETYKIVRLFNKKTGIGDVEFFKKDGDSWLSETCDTPTTTTQKIMDVVGMSHDTFVSSVCFKQNDIAGFAGASATKRKEILKEVLQIGIWDAFQEEAKENEKEFNKKRQALEQRISEIGNIEEEKANSELELNKISDLLKNSEESSIVCQKDLNNVGEQIMKLELEIAKGNHIDKSSLEKRLLSISKRAKDIKELKESYKQEVNKNNEIIAKAASSCDSLENKLITLAKDVLPVDHRHRDKAKQICKEDINVLYGQQSLSDKRGQKEALQKELNTFETHLSQINYLEPGKECPICLTELKNLSKVCELRNIKKNSLKINIDEKKKEISELNSLIIKEEKAIKKADDSIVEIERTELMISKLMASQTEAQRKNEEILNLNVALTSELKELKEEKESIKIGRAHV